jgi:hypothetical protein
VVEEQTRRLNLPFESLGDKKRRSAQDESAEP